MEIRLKAMIKRILPPLLFALSLLPLSIQAAPAKPAGLAFRMAGGAPLLAWDPVEGAKYYRVAIFGPSVDGKAGPLAAAVWVDVVRWHVGKDKVIDRVGKWKSVIKRELKAGESYKWTVSAADCSISQAPPTTNSIRPTPRR